MGDQHGLLREWRRLLSLQLQRHQRMRSNRARRYLCAWMPTHKRSIDVRDLSTSKENEVCLLLPMYFTPSSAIMVELLAHNISPQAAILTE